MLCRYERTIFKSDKGFCIFAYSTSDESVPKEARNRSYYHDDKIHFTAIGYHLIATDAVEVELDGTWENSKHGLQLSVSMCKEVVPRDQAGILAYLSSGIIKGIGPETAKAIVARFGDKTMDVLEKQPDKLLMPSTTTTHIFSSGMTFSFWKSRTRKRLRSWSSRTICGKFLCMVLRMCRFSHLSASEVRLRQMR